MKKRLISLLMVGIMLFSLMPTTAFAQGATSGETLVTYTVNASYEINIPASINLNETYNLVITASVMNTNWGDRVSVFIDGAKTYENGGNFYLYKDKGTPNEAKIRCDLRLSTSVVNGLDFEVARFDDGSTINLVGDPLQITPIGGGPPGTYTGTIYFRITMS
ncbi:MAG: hypothetical protein GX207_02215 [Peptococcaceae bacterium]|nr:hypothetical protein [Peptococcaceae bacterium]